MNSDKDTRRFTYEDCRSTHNIFWYWNERSRLCRAVYPREIKRETPYESFGFFGPESTIGPTVITTGGSAPLILVHKPDPSDQWQEEDDGLLFMFKERFRSEQARIWQRDRKKNSHLEMALKYRPTLQVPPTQFTKKVRNAYEDDSEVRHMMRVHRVLKPDTIDQLSGLVTEPYDTTTRVEECADTISDDASDAGSDTAETVCDQQDLSEVQNEELVANETFSCSKTTPVFRRSSQMTSIDMFAAVLVLLVGYVWAMFG